MTDIRNHRTPPSGGQSDAAAVSQPGSVPQGEEARRAFPSQVEAAIAYASENRYDYGPKLRKMDLDYSVVSARQMGSGIVRVTLEYQPKSRFRGITGSEYLDVDSSGAVVARRQLRKPRESMPWVLIGIAAVSVVSSIGLILAMLLIDEPVDNLYVAGRTLYVRSEVPKVQPVIYYSGPDTDGIQRNWVVLPEGQDTQLAMIHLTVINETSGAVDLVIDQNAAELTLDDGTIVRPINIIERALWPQDQPEQRLLVPGFIPMWGSTTLNRSTQIQGYLVFEIPRGSGFDSLRWSASDVATVRY